MSLEERVDLLETEFNVLKNQIQGVLLDIQNEILIHYYPTMRFSDLDEDNEDTEGSPEPVKSNDHVPLAVKPSPNSSPGTPHTPVLQADVAQVESPGNHDTGISWDLFTQMSDWAYEMVGKIGAEHTREFFELHMRKKGIAPEVRDMLFDFIAILE